MQDNININSLLSDKKLTQILNPPLPQPSKALEEFIKPQTSNPVQSLPSFNPIISNVTTNSPPKISPQKNSIVLFLFKDYFFLY